jgi:hypothetical protein
MTLLFHLGGKSQYREYKEFYKIKTPAALFLGKQQLASRIL